MSQEREISRLLKKRFEVKQDRMEGRPGQLGDGYGYVEVDGREHYVYCRVAGMVEEVFNNRVPAENDLLVIVGYDPAQPNLYQVLSTRTATPGGTTGGAIIGYAPAIRYQWMAPGGGQDPLFVEKRQFLPRRIGPYSGMLIQVYRDIIWTGTAWVVVNTQTVNLTSHIPAAAGNAAFVLITLDTSGTVVATKGSEVAIADLGSDDIPEAPADTREVLGAVRVYAGQTAVQEARNNTDIVDLRFSGWSAGGGMTEAEHTALGNNSPHHAPVTLAAGSPGTLTGQELDLTGIGGTDTNAVHKNVGGEVNAITEKVSPAGTDLLLIEDSADSYNKKKALISNLPGGSGTDADAIHDNVSGEIAALTEKASPANTDLILIEDSEASNAKKKLQIANLPGGSGGGYTQGAYVTDTTPPSIANDSFTTMSFDNEVWDTDGIHDPSTNPERLTCRTAGKYVVTANIAWSSNVTNVRLLGIALNGTVVVYDGFNGSGLRYHSTSHMINLVVGDYLTLVAYQASGSAITPTKVEFGMQRIG